MKKIIVGILSFAMLLVSSGANAATLWNGASNDCRGIAIADHTTGTGIVYPCWPLTTLNANVGDSVNIRLYYHNTSGSQATNVRVALSGPTGTANSFNFSGQIYSDQGSASLGTVSVNIPSGAKLTYGGTHWLPNQSQTESALLYNQKGSEVLSSGLNIGTIASSWSAQGSVVVTFLVERPVEDCQILTFTATPDDVPAGQGSKLAWTTKNCKSVSIEGVGSNLQPNSDTLVYPVTTKTYVITGYGDTGVTPTKSVTVTAGGPVGAPGFPAGAPSYGN